MGFEGFLPVTRSTAKGRTEAKEERKELRERRNSPPYELATLLALVGKRERERERERERVKGTRTSPLEIYFSFFFCAVHGVRQSFRPRPSVHHFTGTAPLSPSLSLSSSLLNL